MPNDYLGHTLVFILSYNSPYRRPVSIYARNKKIVEVMLYIEGSKIYENSCNQTYKLIQVKGT